MRHRDGVLVRNGCLCRRRVGRLLYVRCLPFATVEVRNLMSRVRTKISVAGFSDAEIAAGFQNFLAEFRERSHLMNPRAAWDSARQLLLVSIETEGDDPKLESKLVFDEIWDCVIACFTFSSERISFDILEAELIGGRHGLRLKGLGLGEC